MLAPDQMRSAPFLHFSLLSLLCFNRLFFLPSQSVPKEPARAGPPAPPCRANASSKEMPRPTDIPPEDSESLASPSRFSATLQTFQVHIKTPGSE